MGMTTAVILICVLGIAAGGGYYLYRKTQSGDSLRLFAPRVKRLAYIERTSLDGGRKLLLVRRDDVEHLILIGGPIDLVIETGLRAEGFPGVAPKEDGRVSATDAHPPASDSWRRRDPYLAENKAASPVEARLSLSPKAAVVEDETLELTPLQEAKALR